MHKKFDWPQNTTTYDQTNALTCTDCYRNEITMCCVYRHVTITTITALD